MISHFTRRLRTLRAGGRRLGGGGGADGLEVRVGHRLDGREAVLVVVAKELVEEVDRLGADEVLVLRRDELRPRLPRVAAEDAVKVRVELEVVLVEVVEELVGAEHLQKRRGEGGGVSGGEGVGGAASRRAPLRS